MKIGVLTSSRADYGIYLPLLKLMEADPAFDLEVIAFGTHLSRYHGYTVSMIQDGGFQVIHEISSLLTNDDERSVSTAYGLTALKFAEFWHQQEYDLVFCLGDRFEMSAAVQAAVPYGVKFAHLHGGETTLGAIDNIYRHQISLASKLHFPATDAFAAKIAALTGSSANIFPVGSLSIDDLIHLDIPEEAEFRDAYQVTGEFLLLTFHPETVSTHKNKEFAGEMRDALKQIAEYSQLVITMPNADTNGSYFREALQELQSMQPYKVTLIENFGKLNYFAAMRYCKLLIGNTSSGIIEAASFGKYAVNVGDRQKGRAQSKNIINVPFQAAAIVDGYLKASQSGDYSGGNIYHRPGTAKQILQHLKADASSL